MLPKTLLYRVLVIISALTLFCMTASGQQMSFSSLTTADGLSHITVNDIYIDEYGMVWIATADGLNRYNGYSIDTFYSERNNSSSLPNSRVRRITGDGKGHIWLLCQQSVVELDLYSMKFKTLLSSGAVNDIFYHKENDCLYAGINRKVRSWDPVSRKFINETDLIVSSNILKMSFVGEYVYVGTYDKGVWRINLNNNSHECIIKSLQATDIFEDSKGNVWICTMQGGLYLFGADGVNRVFTHDVNNPSGITSDFIRCCCEDDSGRLWIGTDVGLSCYDPEADKFMNYNSNPSSGITHPSVWCSVKDAQGNIWIGTYYGGVNYFNPEHEVYKTYSRSDSKDRALSNNVVGPMIEDKHGILWIATEGGGLNRLDRSTGKIEYVTTLNSDLSSDNIQSLYYDESKDIIWIGTHLRDLNRLDIRTGKVKSYNDRQAKYSSQARTIKDIEPCGDLLLLATHEGIYEFDPSTGSRKKMSWEKELKDIIKGVSSLYVDSKDNLWIAVDNVGVLCHDISSGKNTMFTPSGEGTLSGKNVSSIIEDDNGRIWFATSPFGIDVYDPETETFTNYDTGNSGMISNRTYTFIRSVTSSNILFSNSDGVCSFDPLTRNFINYDKASGLPVNDVNDNSLYITRDSTIFLGSVHGLLSFKEGTQSQVIKPYNITISRLIVDGNEVLPGDKTGILNTSMSSTSSITLNSDVNMFNIEFAASNYLLMNKSDIQYRLEGFSREWNTIHGLNRITYSKLPPGNYRLVIRPVSHGEMICPPASLNIKVKAPWFMSWYAFVTWFLLFFVVLYVLLRVYLNSMLLRQSVEYEKMKNHDIEELNHAKLQFFSNISHEIRTPLTVIIAQVENLMQYKEFTPSIYNKILSIYQNGVQLRGLITELLEFRKQEQGEMKIYVAPHDIIKLATEFYLVFEEFAISRQITFNMVKQVEHLEVWYDSIQMQKVFRNLISNALKYTDSGGEVNFYLGKTENEMVFRISDTGCGIPDSEIDKIFKNFYRIDRIESKGQDGAGIGLALAKGIVEQHHGKISVQSVVGKGTIFTVTLPLGNSHFKPEQFAPVTSPPEKPVLSEEQGIHVKKKSKTMLVVDDNESIRSLLADIFSPFYNILLASDGEEAWEIVQNELPDIVVSDVLMPKLPGTELCRRIKAEAATCHIPVVLLTARMDVEQNIEGILIGADDYIAKPFNTKFLVSRCNNLVNSRILLQEKFSQSPDMHSKMLATNALDQKLIDKATEIIEANIENVEFNINDFAHEMAMSRTNLFKKMKAITGQTPNDFIMTIRLKKGAYLLRNNPDLSIADIADCTGFASSKYFSKCFTEMYKKRPSAYRADRTK